MNRSFCSWNCGDSSDLYEKKTYSLTKTLFLLNLLGGSLGFRHQRIQRQRSHKQLFTFSIYTCRILFVGILGTLTKRWAIFAKCELCLKSREKDSRGLLARVAYWDHKLRRGYQQPLLVCSKDRILTCICSTEYTSSESMEQSLDTRGPFTEYYEVSSAP